MRLHFLILLYLYLYEEGEAKDIESPTYPLRALLRAYLHSLCLADLSLLYSSWLLVSRPSIDASRRKLMTWFTFQTRGDVRKATPKASCLCRQSGSHSATIWREVSASSSQKEHRLSSLLLTSAWCLFKKL